jgi:hypothetical protein
MASVVIKWSLLGAIVTALGTSPTAYAQVSTGCNGWRRIDPRPANPFTARSLSQHVRRDADGTEHTVFELPGSLARDSNGRTYSEWHVGSPSVPKETQPTTGKGRDRIYSMIAILDCGGGKAITIFPDLKIARVQEGPLREPDHTSFFEMLAYVQRPSNAVFEDLGYKEMEGFSTHGFRVTVLGTQKDGDWNGRPTNVTEAWVSDELAMTMLEIRTNLRTKYETRDSCNRVNRQEPDESVFEIPVGYKINPPPEENPPRPNEKKFSIPG